jgi:hypothetical protein
MANDLYVATKWRHLFKGRPVTKESLVAAEELLDELSPESPLRVRYATELVDIRKLQAAAEPAVRVPARRRW